MNYEDRDWDDDEFDDGYDDSADDSATIPCPECGEEIYEDVDVCPYCGVSLYHGLTAAYGDRWFSLGGPLREWSPFWLFLGMAGVIAVIFVLMMG